MDCCGYDYLEWVELCRERISYQISEIDSHIVELRLRTMYA